MKHARPDYDRIQDPAGKIPLDEPVFLLRAQDSTAAETVRCWASLQPPGILRARAVAHAEAMDRWQTKKTADITTKQLNERHIVERDADLFKPLLEALVLIRDLGRGYQETVGYYHRRPTVKIASAAIDEHQKTQEKES
jgi:hypothetical protein